MSLKDLEDAVEGLWDGGVAASGSALVSSTSRDVVVHAVAVDRQTASLLGQCCGMYEKNALTTAPLVGALMCGGPPLVRTSTHLDALVLTICSDWMPPAWLCVVSLQDILTSHDTSGGGTHATSAAHQEQTTKMAADLTVETSVREWRKFFCTLLRCVHRCVVRVQDVNEQAGTAVLFLPDLQCRAVLRRVRTPADAQKVVMWSCSQIARALTFQTEKVADLERKVSNVNQQLERVTAELTTMARDCGRAPPLNSQSALAGTLDGGTKDANEVAAPVNLVNPQARRGVKRGRGMRIQ